ncbi:MAG TPA: BON domain-containing protein [Candidatus Acidoferrales bacterium]|jgi:hyperosmotically inducible protein|nr:BON domain-containing protein [Candidatus Acidoferrales bacterium]
MSQPSYARLVALFFAVSLLAAFAPSAPAQSQKDRDAKVTANLLREVGHELRMLPRFTVFDDLRYSVEGDHVTLLGAVTNPVLKSDAENSVKRIEGVSGVTDNIRVLPLSPNDDRIRRDVFRAIYGDPSLSEYGFSSQPSIHIIVENGNVSLEGVVNNDGDKNRAGLKANTVTGVFSVKNNLIIAK